VPAEGAEQSEETAISESEARGIDQQGAPAVMKRRDGRQPRVNRPGLDIRSRRLSVGLRRDRNINEKPRVLRFFLLVGPSDGDREGEIVRGRPLGGAAAFHPNGPISRRRGNAIIEGEGMLCLARGGPTPLRPISLDALIQFAAPLLFVGALRREIASRAYARFLRWRHFPGITETTAALARSEHGATLRADCIHRCVLRCGRSHSGEEETRLAYHFHWNVKQEETVKCAEKGSFARGYNSPCCARISRLKAMRRSRTTTAKLAQPARSWSAHDRREGVRCARAHCNRFRISK